MEVSCFNTSGTIIVLLCGYFGGTYIVKPTVLKIIAKVKGGKK